MSISIPRTVNQDWRVVAEKDAANQRKIQIKNIQREVLENQPKWDKKQKELYGNLLQVSPEVTEEEIITMEKQISDDDENNTAMAFQKLMSISSPEVARYMTDRLGPDEIKWLIVNFNHLVRKFKKDKVKLDKDILLNQIKEWSDEMPVSNEKLPLSQGAIARQQVEKERGLQIEERNRQLQQEYDRNVEQQNDMADEEMKGKIDLESENIRRNLRPITENIKQLSNAEEELQGDLEEQRLMRLARQRKDDQINESLLNSNYGAPIKPGTYSSIVNIEANPTPVMNISPNKDLTEETLYDIYSASPPIQGSNKKGRKKKKQQKEFEEIEKIATELGTPPKERYNLRSKGRGLIKGRGMNLKEETQAKRHYIGNFYIELNKLKDNILSVKYRKSDAFIPTVKVQHITNKLKEIIEDVIKNTYDERFFKLLTKEDKRIFKRFVKAVKLDLPMEDEQDKEFQKNYEILLGEWRSGNDAPEIKKALKQYIIEALAEAKITKNDAYFLLYQLSL